MPGPRLFRSRWAALLWAAGIVWFAYDFTATAPHATAAGKPAATDATGQAVDAADLAALANSVVQ
ncbi:hypothetical protein [Sphingomonas sp.]|uniref:hypothetical protein n=1 Tax=Sphingomonas sp. TaxID=28214 RepID=UPI003CC62D04